MLVTIIILAKHFKAILVDHISDVNGSSQDGYLTGEKVLGSTIKQTTGQNMSTTVIRVIFLGVGGGGVMNNQTTQSSTHFSCMLKLTVLLPSLRIQVNIRGTSVQDEQTRHQLQTFVPVPSFT